MVRCTPDTANSKSNIFNFVSAGASEKALLVSPLPRKIVVEFQLNEKTQNSVAKFEGEQSHV